MFADLEKDGFLSICDLHLPHIHRAEVSEDRLVLVVKKHVGKLQVPVCERGSLTMELLDGNTDTKEQLPQLNF